ncbi:hypothetical protein GCM10009117_21240 [Gangjinia marincola]|uniref:Uncharacterized protein n=1 Tax=Gangjinia marincola TaxID=578463 RepID=A0ABN1MJA0_9FLAO
MEFIETLKERNAVLLWFGIINLSVAFLLIFFSYFKPIEFAGTNAWYKPIKFALSTTILSLSIAWYSGYLTKGNDINLMNWVIIITLAFEVIYITWQASKGQASHYNQSSPFYSFMFSMMALAATIATIAIGCIGYKFFLDPINDLPNYYLWAIRFGFILFVIFSFEGFVMGGNMAHTVGANDGVKGLPFLNWSLSYGDLRIAHFIGMHALQVLPLLAWYFLKNIKLTVLASVIYTLLAIFILVMALRGNSIFKF